MQPIPIGATGHFALVVGQEHLASQVKDAALPPVLATPIMVMMMENAALAAIRRYFDPGETSVGSAVDIRHLAATPAGQRVTAEAVVTKVEGRRVHFSVSAADESETIGTGTHERVVIDVAKFAHRLAAKAV